MTNIEKIKAEIINLKKVYPNWQVKNAADDLLSFIESLEKEQAIISRPSGAQITLGKIASILSKYEDKEGSPLEQIRSIVIDETIEGMEKEQNVNLDKILSGYLGHYAYENGGEYPSASEIANHFYELGCRHAAVLYDDIEKERRKRQEEESAPKQPYDEVNRDMLSYIYDVCKGTMHLMSKEDFINCVMCTIPQED